jgi:hypothetical protein
MNPIEPVATAVAVLMNAPGNVDASQTVLDLLLSAVSDAGRMMDSDSAYWAMGNAYTGHHSYFDWMAHHTGVGTADDYRQWMEANGKFPSTIGDYQGIEDLAASNDPFYRFYHGVTGKGWAEYASAARR